MAEPWSVIRDWKARCWNPEAPFQVRCCLSSEAHGPMQGSRPQINNTTCISKCAMSRRSCADPSQLCPCLVRRPRKGTMGGGGRKEHDLENHRNRAALLSDWHHQEGKERGGLPPHFWFTRFSALQPILNLSIYCFHSRKELLQPRLRAIYGFRYKYLVVFFFTINIVYLAKQQLWVPPPHLWGLCPPASWSFDRFTMPGLYCFLTSKPEGQLENNWLTHDIQATVEPMDTSCLAGQSL